MIAPALTIGPFPGKYIASYAIGWPGTSDPASLSFGFGPEDLSIPSYRPYIVGIGGALYRGSTTELAIRHAFAQQEVELDLFTGPDLDLPLYAAHAPAQTPAVARLLRALRRADGVVIGSPGYHGGVSGVVKNVLDYTEFLRQDDRPYLSGRAVGCIANAAGWQGAMSTLAATRDIVHALRGWPTPLGVCIAGPIKAFDPQGRCLDATVDQQLRILAAEVLQFAHGQRLTHTAEPQAKVA